MSEWKKAEAAMAEENPGAEVSLEEAFQQLEILAERLEDRAISLEESFELYEKGMALLKYCSNRIDQVEKRMLQVNEQGELSEF